MPYLFIYCNIDPSQYYMMSVCRPIDYQFNNTVKCHWGIPEPNQANYTNEKMEKNFQKVIPRGRMQREQNEMKL